MRTLPVRKITNHNRRNRIGKFPSAKMGRMIMWESPLERDYIYLLEWDRDVQVYKEQPLKIFCPVDDAVCSYTPDFWVERVDDIDLVEVKSSKYLNTPEAILQKEIGTEYCQQEGLNHLLITEQEIRKGHFLGNIKILFRYSRMIVSFSYYNKIIGLVNKRAPLTIDDLNRLLRDVGGDENFLPIIYYLIFNKNLNVDLNKPLSSSSMIQGGVLSFENHGIARPKV